MRKTGATKICDICDQPTRFLHGEGSCFFCRKIIERVHEFGPATPVEEIKKESLAKRVAAKLKGHWVAETWD